MCRYAEGGVGKGREAGRQAAGESAAQVGALASLHYILGALASPLFILGHKDNSRLSVPTVRPAPSSSTHTVRPSSRFATLSKTVACPVARWSGLEPGRPPELHVCAVRHVECASISLVGLVAVDHSNALSHTTKNRRPQK